MNSKKVVAFDIGIKNLAYCILELDTQVVALDNVNILGEVEHIRCALCQIRASYKAGDNVYCKRHVPENYKILPELSKKKLPANKVLKQLLATHSCEKLGTSTDKCIESLSKKFAIYYNQPKQANASRVSIEIIHDSLRTFVRERWQQFSGCTHVLLENQPAFKNPHMKSVQVLLFATLREAFLANHETPIYHFVHAKNKVKNAAAGDEGYNERKTQSQQRLIQLFETGKVANPYLFSMWNAATKKSDMADALCMCVDCS
jgi:hypothetical protein